MSIVWPASRLRTFSRRAVETDSPNRAVPENGSHCESNKLWGTYRDRAGTAL